MSSLGSFFKFMVIVFLCLLVGGVLSCGGQQPSLIGKWQSASGETFEFFKDGTITMRGDAGPSLGHQTFMGRYNLIEENRLSVDVISAGVKQTLIFSYTLSQDTLTLKNEEKGEVCTYNRVQGATTASTPAPATAPRPAETPLKSRPQAVEQSSSPIPHLEPLQQSLEEHRPPDRFSLDEERPPTAPAQPEVRRPMPQRAPLPSSGAWGGRWTWTSARLILPEDLMPLSLRELELMRNEIYARHGWVFNRRDLREYFSRQPWYAPKGDLYNRDQVNRWVEAELSPLEKRNIQIIIWREKALRR